jgi:hypothetical protein
LKFYAGQSQNRSLQSTYHRLAWRGWYYSDCIRFLKQGSMININQCFAKKKFCTKCIYTVCSNYTFCHIPFFDTCKAS